MSTREPLALIGVGTMGAAFLRRLTAAGYSVRAHDPSPAAQEQARAAGAGIAASAAAAAAEAGIVLLCLPDDEALLRAVSGPGGVLEGARPGTLLADLGTTTPRRSRELASSAEARGLAYLDALVSGSVPWAEQGRLAVMVGGGEADFRRCLPVLETFGSRIFHLGPVGSGQAVKLCHQLAFMAILAGLGEAVAMGERYGLEGTRVLEVLDACVAPRHVIEFFRPRLAVRDFSRSSGGLALGLKDLESVLQLAREDAGIRLPLAAVLRDYFRQAVDSAGGEYDLFGLVDLVARGSIRP